MTVLRYASIVVTLQLSLNIICIRGSDQIMLKTLFAYNSDYVK